MILGLIYGVGICTLLLCLTLFMLYGCVLCQVGRTEMIKDTLNPDFVKHFIVDYFFEESQKIRFELLAYYSCFLTSAVFRKYIDFYVDL